MNENSETTSARQQKYWNSQKIFILLPTESTNAILKIAESTENAEGG
jgi:hypothetical protein